MSQCGLCDALSNSELMMRAERLFDAVGGWNRIGPFEACALLGDAYHVERGRQTGTEAEVTAGLTEGMTVIVHPGDLVREGGRIAEQNTH